MASSSSPFSNSNKFQVLPNSTTVLFTPSSNNNLTIGNSIQNIRSTTTPNGTYIQQHPITTGSITTPTSIVRFNQPNQFTPQTIWTNNSPMVKSEPSTPGIQQQGSILPMKLAPQPVVRQTVTAQQGPKFTDAQINDFVAKCRTFLTTLLKLAEKQAPEKLPMVKNCIQNLLDGSIDPESFTQRLHTLYKSQPHTSLVPFFKLALPHMRLMVQNAFNQPITIELLEKLNLPSSKINLPTMTTATTSRVVVNPSLLTQQSSTMVQQPLLYTTVQPQQKINLLQQTPQPALLGSTASLLSQQQQQQQQARAQISITGIRPILSNVSPSSNTNLLTGQQQIQPVTQTIIQQSDSSLQRAFLSPLTTTGLQQPHIITMNHPVHAQIQQRMILKNDDERADDTLGNNGLLMASSGPGDTQHIVHDNRFLPPSVLRQRLDQLIKKDKRWDGGNILIHDDSIAALISHATEERLKYLIEQMKSMAQQRSNLSILIEHTSNNERGQKRQFENDTDLHEQLKDLKSIKRKCQANLQDLTCTMETDKHLKRSTLLYKALDKF